MRRFLLLVAVLLGISSSVLADEPEKKYQVISPKPIGIIATAINDHGEIIGFDWMEDKAHPGVMEQRAFFAKGKEMTYIPLLAGYTATFPAGLSENGIVVGRSSKPGLPDRRIYMRNQAFIWDAKNGMRGLGVLQDDWASFASWITRDGRRVSGYSIGDNRLRACVWDRDGDGWKKTAMPQEFQLSSNTVAMSGSGKYLSAVDGGFPCLWTQAESGSWTRKTIGESNSLVPRAVNDSGMVVGIRFTNDGMTHAVVWTAEGGQKLLPLPAGYVKSEALAINDAGAVVGMIDGPSGSELGPNGFVYENGKLRILSEGGKFFSQATAVNNKGQVAGVLEEEEGDHGHADAEKKKDK